MLIIYCLHSTPACALPLFPFDGTRKVQGECRIKLACSAEPQPLLALANPRLQGQRYEIYFRL